MSFLLTEPHKKTAQNAHLKLFISLKKLFAMVFANINNNISRKYTDDIHVQNK